MLAKTKAFSEVVMDHQVVKKLSQSGPKMTVDAEPAFYAYLTEPISFQSSFAASESDCMIEYSCVISVSSIDLC